MLKKILLTISASMIAMSSANIVGATTLPPVQKPSLAIDLIVDGKKVTLPDTEPFIDNAGNTMVPIRFVSEKLGAEVLWNNATQVVTISHKGKTIVMPVGSKNVTVDGQAVTLATSAIKKEGRVMVPLRFVSEALQADVSWNGTAYYINITSPEYQAKVDAGSVTLDKYGRELRAVQNSDKWILMSDTPDTVYNIKWRDVISSYGNGKITSKEYSEEFTKTESDTLAKRVKEYYKLALNSDYRTINFNNYFKDYTNNTANYGYVNPSMSKSYVNFVKSNKLITEGYAFPDTSTIYHNKGKAYIRTKFKFRVVSAADYSQFSMDSWNPSKESESPKWVKKGVWYETYSDIVLGTNHQDIEGTLRVANTENMFLKGLYVHKELK